MHNCTICDQTYVNKQNLYRHERQKHGLLRNKNLHCFTCNSEFKNKVLLKKHVKLEHSNGNRKKSERILCSGETCDASFSRYKFYHDHLLKDHKIAIEKQHFTFNNMLEFDEWRINTEEDNVVSYVMDTTPKNVKGSKKYYFLCSRSYQPRTISNENRKRHLKNCGSNKISVACPSIITVTQTDKVDVTYFPLHFGHECELGRMKISNFDRNKIAVKGHDNWRPLHYREGKLSEGVTIQRVLTDVRDKIQNHYKPKRIDLLEKKDLHNIKRDFKISYSTKLHENDAISVNLWVTLMKTKYSEKCPVLLYKMQGEEMEGGLLDKDDFILVIMTQFQENEFLKYGTDKICVDGTHGLNAYGFQLYTIVVVDNIGKGVPVAFCFSNKCVTKVYQQFFISIKERIGIISAKIFMSDDEPAFYNAWESVMGPTELQLLCTWHIRQNWFKNLNKISNMDKRKTIFKTLKVLQTEVNKENFFVGLNKFVHELQNDTDTATFGEYFVKYYVSRTDKWAYCARMYVGINTNMFLEALHKKIKHVYLEGKVCKRLDKAVDALLTLVRDIAVDKMIALSKIKLTPKIAKIRESHKKSLLFGDDSITYENDTKIWKISSKDKFYTIQEKSNKCPNEDSCFLRCSECSNICVHEYICSCLDNIIHFNICKHIHAVASRRKKQNLNMFIERQKEINSTFEELPGLINTNFSLNNDTSLNLLITEKCEMLLGIASRAVFTDDIKRKINEHLDKALECANSTEVSFTQTQSVMKRKISTQIRFYGKTNKKQKTTPHASKIEEEIIRNSFLCSPESRTLNIHDTFDHSYSK